MYKRDLEPCSWSSIYSSPRMMTQYSSQGYIVIPIPTRYAFCFQKKTDFSIVLSGIESITGRAGCDLIPTRRSVFQVIKNPSQINFFVSLLYLPSIASSDQNINQKATYNGNKKRHSLGSMYKLMSCHVTNLAECSRGYGGKQEKTKKCLFRIVTAVDVVTNPSSNQSSTFINSML